MVRNWKSRFIAACAGIVVVAGACAPAVAQVEWVTPLQSGWPERTSLTTVDVNNASDGSVIATSYANDGEAIRIRIASLTPAGVERWVRWAGVGSAVPLPKPLMHADGSVTVLYAQSNFPCLENFDTNGIRRMQVCLGVNDQYGDTRIARSLDDEIFVGYGTTSRAVRKMTRSGQLVWETVAAVSTNGTYVPNGVDSAGNYFEVVGNSLLAWSGTNGLRLNNAALASTSRPSGRTSWSLEGVPRANREAVVFRSVAGTSNAVTANVGRFGSDGSQRWNRDLIFPAQSDGTLARLMPADSDGIYVVRTAVFEDSLRKSSEIAKLSAAGAVLWQRHYAGAAHIIERAGSLFAIRLDGGTNPSNAYIFPISAFDGALGAPIIYTRNSTALPTGWFVTNAGVVGAFPRTGGDHGVFIFFGNTPTDRWVNLAIDEPKGTVGQDDCLMPRLARSSPTGWWARTKIPQSTDWASVDGVSGSIAARSQRAEPSCGTPITNDGGRVVVRTTSPRAEKFDATGSSTWQATSALNPALDASRLPVQAIASNGDAVYLLGSLLGRVSGTGSIVFETETNRPGGRYLGVDSANNTWVLTSDGASDARVSKFSPSGGEVWSTAVDVAACNDQAFAALLTGANEMLVTTQSCAEGRVFKIDAAGQVVWQRAIVGTGNLPFVQLTSLQTDAVGNIYAGGCVTSNNTLTSATFAKSLAASWTSAGTARWSTQADLLGNGAECVTSIAVDGTGNTYASASLTGSSVPPILWSLDTTGAERWRHATVLTQPAAANTELAFDGSGKLVALGETPPDMYGVRRATLRRINVASIGSSLLLKFLTVPAPPINYREQFPVTVGLTNASGVTATATAATMVSVQLLNGSGALDGSLACTIAIGASQCTIADTRYNVVESGVVLSAGADGFASVSSAPIAFKAADTTVALSVATAAPYDAFSVVRVRAALQAPPPPSGQTVAGSISGPFGNTSGLVWNCANLNVAGTTPVNECDLLVRSVAMPVTASFVSAGSTYMSSVGATLSLTVTKAVPTIVATFDPTNSYVAGDRVRMRVSLFTTNGFNVSRFIASGALAVTGGTCGTLVALGSLADKFAGSYWVCEVPQTVAGSFSATLSFNGNADLLAATPITKTATISAGAIVRGSGSYIPAGVSICSPTPGVTCGLTGNANSEWQCSGPASMSGQVFFVPPSNGSALVFRGAPLQFNNVNGLVTTSASIQVSAISTTCSLDVDGDGAMLSITDGVLILRRILGLAGSALVTGATHACAPRSAAGIAGAVNLFNYDIDGDGETRAETDGLLILRAMLGFSGDALILNAVGPNAARKTALEIRNFLTSNCSLPFN